jgi:acetyl-CoA carboxylase biotin carboxyl carrier protein
MKDSERQIDAGATRKQRNAPPEGKSGGERAAKGQQRPEASVNMDELRELIALLRENDLAEFELEREGFRVRLRRGVDFESAEMHGAALQQPPPPPAAREPKMAAGPGSGATPSHPGAQAETAASEDQDLHLIASPIVGTFYRSRSPNAGPFVKTGSQVESTTIVCIIEAMKLMNEIQAETSGEVVKIYVENGQPVEYGQPLFGIKR